MNLLRLGKVRWPESGTWKSYGVYVFFSGSISNKNRSGVAVKMSDSIAKFVVDIIPINKKILFMSYKPPSTE